MNDDFQKRADQDVNAANSHMSEIRLTQQRADVEAGIGGLPIIPKPTRIEVTEDTSNPDLITSITVSKATATPETTAPETTTPPTTTTTPHLTGPSESYPTSTTEPEYSGPLTTLPEVPTTTTIPTHPQHTK